MKKPTSKQTRLFQAKMFPRNGTTGQIDDPSMVTVDVNYDPSMVTALQHGTWMDEEGFKKTCTKKKKKRGGIHQPLYST